MVKRRSSHTKRRKHRGSGFFDGLFGIPAATAVPAATSSGSDNSQVGVGGPPRSGYGAGYGGRSRRRSRKTKRRSRRGGNYY